MKTLIVDNYDSFTFNLFHLAARVNGEEPVVVRNDEITWEEFEKLDVDNVIISPGPGRPENERDFGICRQILLESPLPILGVCLGLQGVGHVFGAKIVRAPEPVHGRTSPIFHEGAGIFEGLPQGFNAVRYHSLMVSKPVPGCLRISAWTEDGLIMGLEHRERPIWSVQFHPESISTEYGECLLKNFAARTPRRARTSVIKSDSTPHRPPLLGEEGKAQWRIFSRRIKAYPDPEHVFLSLFRNECPAFWLDSSLSEDGNQNRFSYMGATGGPQSYWLSHSTTERRLILNASGRREIIDTPLLGFLQSELARRRVDADDLLFDFNGGMVGYFGYELKAECGSASQHKPEYPDGCLIFADRMIVFDHHDRAVHLVYVGNASDSIAATTWFDETEHRLSTVATETPAPLAKRETIRFRLEQDRREYLDGIDRCLNFIREGESYEICLTNRLIAETTVNPLDYYRVLRRFNPAPYSAFLRFPDVSIACSSPESFLKVNRHGTVESRPVKGTAPCASNIEADALVREALRTGVKTRSENLMIVDLLRHDLGRVCEIGSVHAPRMMEVESHRNLHQLVSTISGRLRPDATAIDCLRSAFPGGSMTGAPKLRTMELIERLESSARGVYSGAIGFIALNGAANLNIVIRTAVFAGGRVSIGSGGAIVALSDPAAEFDEMILKSRALVDAFRPLVEGGVSIEGLTQAG